MAYEFIQRSEKEKIGFAGKTKRTRNQERKAEDGIKARNGASWQVDQSGTRSDTM